MSFDAARFKQEFPILGDRRPHDLDSAATSQFPDADVDPLLTWLDDAVRRLR